ncbi:hypothetical protein F4777DRAFT_350858 [Nemania sp. FL0916]|nr:hypothetical protein F4777DRAFT_350858 [Nemania sp. FL0916]
MSYDLEAALNSETWDSEAFIKQIVPKAHIATPAEVRTQAKTRSESIYASYTLLHEMLLFHELTIQKRWAKKTRQQRQKTLLDNWPGMAPTHRPDFAAFRRTNRGDGRSNVPGDEFRDHYMWPYINQEDLLLPKSLLLLLNARGRNPPPAFASADFKALQLGTVSKNVAADFLNCYVMILHGAQDAREYGKLIAWDDHPDAFDWLHTRKQFLPGEGLLVLEAQDRLLKFLVGCCRQILSDILSKPTTTPNLTVQPEPYLKTEQESSGFESLAVMAAEAPYRLPSRLDLQRIELVLGGRVAAAEDHLWALREDPGYFLEQLIEVKEHRQELLKDTYGNDHPVLKTVHQDIFWARVCGTLPTESYLSLEMFAELHQQAQTLLQLHKKYAREILPMKDLPDEFLSALLKFRHYLYQAAKGPLGSLRHHVVPSTPWARYFVRQPPPDSTTSKIVVMSKGGVRMNDTESNLLWLLQTLWNDDTNLVLFGLTLVVDELGRVLETEPRAKDLVTARIANAISDLAIISQCISQIDTYFPWARGYISALIDREDGIKKEFAERTSQWDLVLSALHEKNLSHIAKLGNPVNQKFVYPIEKRRTKQNVESLRRAEQNLDDFWAAVDRLIHVKCGHLSNSAQQRLLSQPRTIRRTPEWVEPAPSATKSGKEAVMDPDVEQLYKPLSTIYIGESAGTSSTTTPSAPKQKTKTKPTTIGSDVKAAAPAPAEVIEPAPLSIPVDSRALKVFRTLFYNPAASSSPGEVAWTDFLHAMTSTGLFSAEKLYGSSWQFQRREGDQSRIQFHEPHPRGRIPFVIARRHGRRLNRAFGWVGETFCLKEK